MRDLSGHRKSLGWLYMFVHLLVLLGAGGLAYATWLVALVVAHGNSTPPVTVAENPAVLGMSVFVLVLLAMAIAGLSLGVALIRGRPVSKGLATLLAILALPNFPLGTVLGIYSFWYFGQEGWDADLQEA
ncbi:hypothetical protein D7Y23_25535 [Corallococcus sp. AB050B]|nr:hypothetical protein D7Y23_25535 [Corallococcus sp. AB050B]